MTDIRFQHVDAKSESPVVPASAETTAPAPWEMIENGRYQPRRIKGSCVGRELG